MTEMRPNALSADRPDCWECGAAFTKRRPWHRFCSDACRAAYHAKGGRLPPNGYPTELRLIVAENIRIARARSRLSQVEFAKKAGIAVTTLAHIERAETNSRIDSIAMIAAYLDIPPSRLLEPMP